MERKEVKVKFSVIGTLGTMGNVIEDCNSLKHAIERYNFMQKHYKNVMIQEEIITTEIKFWKR